MERDEKLVQGQVQPVGLDLQETFDDMAERSISDRHDVDGEEVSAPAAA